MHPLYHLKHSTYFAFLIETFTSFQPPFQTALTEIRRVHPLTIGFLNTSIPLQGHVRDAATNQPLAATYRVQQLDWRNGESRQTDRFGRYSFFAPGGSYTFIFSSTGYQDRSVQVTIPDENSNNSNVVDVLMNK